MTGPLTIIDMDRSFAELLAENGIEPGDVTLVRHTPSGVKVPLAAWRDRRSEFEEYQSYQHGRSRKLFGRPYWASFVGLSGSKALLAGLYSAEAIGPVMVGSTNPFTGANLDPSTDTRYRLTRIQILSELTERLVLDWGGSTVSWVQSGSNLKTYQVLDEPYALEVSADAKGPRNPPWLRDELILALELYLSSRGQSLTHSSPAIGALSATLASLGEALGHTSSETYRNPNGVYMKLMNFRRFDPELQAAGKAGLSRGNALEG
jgi:hypothetical protein